MTAFTREMSDSRLLGLLVGYNSRIFQTFQWSSGIFGSFIH